MDSHDAEASSQKSSEKSRRTLAGLRQLSDDAKGFFKDSVAKAKHVRDDLRHKKGEPSTPTRQLAPSPPPEVSPLVLSSPPTSPSVPSTPWSPRLSWVSKALPPQPKASEKTVPRQPTPALSSPAPKLHHLSVMRVGLTSLVVLHHAAIPYGGLGSWGWHSPSFPGTSLPLAAFNAVNQTWFMAGFFWMAGYFTHVHLRQLVAPKGPNSTKATNNKDSRRLGPFVANRAARLLVPAIAYTLLAAPLASLMILVNQKGTSTTLPEIQAVLKTYFRTLHGLKGPVWFSAVLFLFDSAAAALASFAPTTFQQWPTWSASPKRAYLLSALTLSATTAFLTRLAYPVGTVFTPLNLQPAFLPQYLLSYALGHFCAATGSTYLHSLLYPHVRERPLSGLALSTATTLLGLAATCASVLVGPGRKATFLLSHGGWERLAGGWSLPAAAYAVWNELGCVTLLPAVVAVCERYCGRAGLLEFRMPRLPFVKREAGRGEVKRLDRYAYATFLVHPVVSFGVELLVERFVLGRVDVVGLRRRYSWFGACGPVLATAMVGAVNVVASWAAGIAMVEWLPLVGRWI